MASGSACLHLVVLMVMLVHTPRVDACSCQLGHPQQYYCSADYGETLCRDNVASVIKAVVKTRVVTERVHTVRYGIRIIKTFKTSDAFEAANTSFVYTAKSESMCGLRLLRGQKYLISGNVEGRRLRTGTCDYSGVWTSLTRWQKRGITSLFKNNCDCKVEICFQDHCYAKNEIEGREDRCILDIHRDRDLCHIRHSRCARRDGECQWKRTGEFKRCRQSARKRARAQP